MEGVYIAEGVRLVGDVALEEGVGVWYNTVIRADHGRVTIKKNTNIQDNCTIHTQKGHDMTIEEGVTVGHGAILHGEYIGENSLIGMGAILLNGTKIGKDCIVGAGALVTGGTIVPDGSMVFGSPAKVVRPLREEEIDHNRENARIYVKLAEDAMMDA